MIVVIVGPTGVGKTKLSIALAQRMNAEIINGDSMQVYKGLDIATAKIKENEKEGIIHHLFDMVSPNENYTVYDYQKDCRNAIQNIINKGKNVIIVGGTGLYIKAALYDYDFQEEKTKYDFSNMSNEELLNRIESVDPNTHIHVNNRQRLERAYTRILNHVTNNHRGDQPLFDFKMIGLTTDREHLYQRINERVEQMIQEGLIEEAKNLYDQNIRSKAVNTGIGYKELYQYFDGNIGLEEAKDLIKKNSRHYAKRQYTFFQHQFHMNWFFVNDANFHQTIEEVYHFLNKEE